MLAMRAGCRLGGLRVPAARALTGVRMVHATPMVLTNPELFPVRVGRVNVALHGLSSPPPFAALDGQAAPDNS